MTVDAILSAPLAVQIHVIGAVTALALTPVQLWRRPGDITHKQIGYIWVLAMALTSVSSFWIHELRLVGAFSPIHLLSAWVLYSLVCAIRAVRRGDIAAHGRWLRSCAFWGLGVAGLFTLLPGRRMSQLLFPGVELAGFVGMAAGLVACVVVLRLRRPIWAYAASARMR